MTPHHINFNIRYLIMPEGQADVAATLDVSSLTSALTTGAFSGVISTVLPIVGVAVLVGFLFYTVRWAIGLFRGI